jgi:hypothetical protein
MTYLYSIENKYDVSSLSYPIDIHASEYGGNMVVFYINVSKSSKFLPPDNQTYDMSNLDVPRDRGLLVGRPISNVNAAISSAVGGALGGLVGGALGGFGGIASGATAIGAAGLFAAGNIAGTTTREQKRLKTAIALHMPNTLNIRYSTSWDTEDTGTTEALSKVGEDAMGLLKSLGDVKLSNMLPQSTKNASSTLGTDVKNIGASELLQKSGTMSARTGLAGNPKKEMVFKGVDFRTFQFDYNFFPRDEQEAEHVYNIIYQFKLHMHPEYMSDTSNFLYVYPSEFDISYYSNSGVNQYIHRHPSCVLTEMSVNYTPNGNFTTFANGMPTQIAITLSFKELSAPTKESIQGQGY